jgi:hypothetical protein
MLMHKVFGAIHKAQTISSVRSGLFDAGNAGSQSSALDVFVAATTMEHKADLHEEQQR